MKGRVILVGRLGTRGAAALMVDGRLEDFAIDPPPGTPVLGQIVSARIGRPAPGKGAWFAEAETGQALFLRSTSPLRQGETLTVQLGAYAEPGKARPASTEITQKSRFFVLTPGRPGLNVSRQIKDQDEAARLRALVAGVPDGTGLIVRTAAAGLPEDMLAADLDAVLAGGAATGPMTAQHLAEAEWTAAAPDWIGYAEGCQDPHAPSLDDLAREGEGDPLEALGVWDQLETALGAELALGAAGGWMSVEPTRALVAVDVNTGADFSPAAGLKTNSAALAALPRALRLRGLGGQITLDPAPMPKKDRREVEGVLRRALRSDPVETSFVGWTPLGHMELTRKRERWPLLPAELEEAMP